MKFLKNKTLVFLILTLIVAVPSFFKILRPGFFSMQDLMQVFRTHEMDRCFADGQFPCRWVPDAGYGYGYPQFNFYAPLAYYVGEVFHLAGLAIVDSLKIVAILAVLLGVIGMFLLVNEFFGGVAGIVSSTLYTYLPYKAQEFYVRGDISEFLAMAFFPVILWAIYKLIKNGSQKYIFYSAISIGGLFLSHVLFSILFIPVLVFWSGYWLIAEKKIKYTPKIILTMLLGFAVSASFTLPMLLEKKFAHVETLLGGYFDYRQHFVTLQQLFLSNHWGYGSSALGPVDDLTLSTGIVQWVMAAAAVIFALVKFRKDKKTSLLVLSLGVITFLILFLTHQKSSFIWSALPPLAFLQFPWRLLGFSGFILSFLAGYAIYNFTKLKYLAASAAVLIALFLNLNFFAPKDWMNVGDEYFLTGSVWQSGLTASIFDYLPIYAQLPPPHEAPDYPEVLDGKAEFTDYFKGSNYQTGRLIVGENARIRVPLFDFPGMAVYLNGEKISHTNTDCSGQPFCMGLITFNVATGSYDFRVQLEDTPVRTIGNILSAGAIFTSVLILFKKDEKIS